MAGYVVAGLLILFLIGYVVRLKLKIKKLRQSFKEVLNDLHNQMPKEQRNKGEIYLHLDKDMNITFMNDMAREFFHLNPEKQKCSAADVLARETPANLTFLQNCLNRLSRNPETINNKIALKFPDNRIVHLKIRIRPILDEILNCVGMSIVLRDDSETELLRQKLKNIGRRDILNKDILNEKAFSPLMEREFNRCKRYNLNFSLIMVELRDIYDFVCRGINFETGDQLLIKAGRICHLVNAKNQKTARLDKTKLAIMLPETARENAAEIASGLYYPLVKMVQQLGVDKANAQMMVISYTNLKNFNDSPDALMGRLNRHIAQARRRRDYGIKSSDRKDL